MTLEDKIARKMRENGLDDFSYSTRLRAASAALAAIRETHVIAPKEPTEAMVKAGANDGEWHSGYAGRELQELAQGVYTAMLQAIEEE